MSRNLIDNYRHYTVGEKIRIAVIFQVASYWPSIESFYNACIRDEGVEIKIFYVHKTSVEKAQVIGSDEFLRKNNISFEYYSEEKIIDFAPHAALYQPPYDVSYRNPDALSIHLKNMGIRIIYIPYGIEIADTEDARFNHFHTFVVRNAWRIYTFSEIMREDYVKYCPNRNAVKALGIPKFDSLSDKNRFESKDIKERAAGRKIILLKLHFPKLIYDGNERKQVTPDIMEYRKLMADSDDYKNIYWIIMPHPMFFSETIDSELSKQALHFLKEQEGKENVYVDRSEDYRISLYNADAIIIDRSAVMVEAGFMGVPVMYMTNKEYNEPLTSGIKNLVDSYEQGSSYEDMKQFADKISSDLFTVCTERINEAKEKLFPFEFGKCGENILNDIKSGICESKSNVVKLVFFGASYICRHYIEALKLNDSADMKIICMSDNNREKWGKEHCGYSIVPPQQLQKIDFDILVISSEQYYMPIKKQLVYELNIDEEKIMRLDRFAELLISD